MASPQTGRDRVIILARPALGRRVEGILRDGGYEVHRTPDGAHLTSLVSQLQPRLVIVALDLPWVNALHVAQGLAERPRSVPVLLLGDDREATMVNGMARLPFSVDAEVLTREVRRLLGSVAPD